MKTECDIDFLYYSELLKALGHPVRLKIVVGILCEGCNVNGIVERLQIPQSTVSQHLAVLRNKGIITAHKDGVNTCYKVENDFVLRTIELLKRRND
ncbi:MAG: ArsR/SmtB family transcription factor [Spirochaetota bacterium]